MPPKRSAHRPPLPKRAVAANVAAQAPADASSSSTVGNSAADAAINARWKKVDRDVLECRKLFDKVMQRQRDHYLFHCGVFCEFVPGFYSCYRDIVTRICDIHMMMVDPMLSKGILSLEKRRDQIKAHHRDMVGTASSRESDLCILEQYTTRAVKSHPAPMEIQARQAETHSNLQMARNFVNPPPPPVTAEQRANATSHTNTKTLPKSYMNLIRDAMSQDAHNYHIARQHLENAVREVPGCHIGWRLLALLLFEEDPSKKPIMVERIAEDLVPLNYLGKVVQLLPKDVGTWWCIGKLLLHMEGDYNRDFTLRSYVFVTINGKPYTSRDCFARVLELEPNVPDYWLYLGKSMLRSHHPFATEECRATINFEGGPTMTDVTARYCHEAFLRIHPDVTTKYRPWYDVVKVMLSESDVMADVDDAFTSIAVDGGATTLTRPDVLAKMISIEPTNGDVWLWLYHATVAEPGPYRLPITGISNVPDGTLSAQYYLARGLELGKDGAVMVWVMVFDHLDERDTLRIALHDVYPHPDDNHDDIKTPSTATILGKQFNKLDILLMMRQIAAELEGKVKEDTTKKGYIAHSQIQFVKWLMVATLASETPDGTCTLPKGKEALALVGPFPQEDILLQTAFVNALEEPSKWTCDTRKRLLRLLRDHSADICRVWPAAPIVYDMMRKQIYCIDNCPTCCILIATCLKLSPSPPSDAHTKHVAANINTCAEVEPSTWYELGRLLRPGDTVTTAGFTAGDDGKVYTKRDYFKLAIESPKRWNRAGSWLELGKTLCEGESIVIHNKSHTQEDCFKQSRLWFDERPHDMVQLTRRGRAPVTNHPELLELMEGDEDSDSGSGFTEEEEGDEDTPSEADQGGGSATATEAATNDGHHDDHVPPQHEANIAAAQEHRDESIIEGDSVVEPPSIQAEKELDIVHQPGTTSSADGYDNTTTSTTEDSISTLPSIAVDDDDTDPSYHPQHLSAVDDTDRANLHHDTGVITMAGDADVSVPPNTYPLLPVETVPEERMQCTAVVAEDSNIDIIGTVAVGDDDGVASSAPHHADTSSAPHSAVAATSPPPTPTTLPTPPSSRLVVDAIVVRNTWGILRTAQCGLIALKALGCGSHH